MLALLFNSRCLRRDKRTGSASAFLAFDLADAWGDTWRIVRFDQASRNRRQSSFDFAGDRCRLRDSALLSFRFAASMAQPKSIPALRGCTRSVDLRIWSVGDLTS